jgi:hypothetical protein
MKRGGNAKKIVVGGLFLVVILAFLAFVALRRDRPDEFAALAPNEVQSDTQFFSAQDLAKINAIIGTPSATPIHDIIVHILYLNSAPRDQVQQTAAEVGKRRGWKLAKRSANMTIYSPSGTVPPASGVSEQLVVVFGKHVAQFPSGQRMTVDTTIMDTTFLSMWDQLRIRSNHSGRIPYTDPMK